jgi:hypothetical protein
MALSVVERHFRGFLSIIWASRWHEALLAILFLILARSSRPLRLARLWTSVRSLLSRTIILAFGLPALMSLEALKSLASIFPDGILISSSEIDESTFPDEGELQRILDRLGNAGSRTTGSKPHNDFINWIENELENIPGLSIRTDEYDILRWQTVGGASLKNSGHLSVLVAGKQQNIPIAGVVPFSLSTPGQSGELVYLAKNIPITEANAKGKIILRELPAQPVPYSMIFLPSYSKTVDLNADSLSIYDRPGQADMPLKEELIAAGKAGATGMIIMFGVEKKYIESYFEPHQGVHYRIPAVFVGIDEATFLQSIADSGVYASLSVNAETAMVQTRSIFATLPGQISEKVIFQTHTDGNTFVQENGATAVLTLAQYYAKQPLNCRRRTLEFALTTGHLHISREGTARHAEELNLSFDGGNDVALVIPVEHLGTREIEAYPRSNGQPGMFFLCLQFRIG